ncbi:hypothetical protein PHABIO_436 [Pseudomonas phage Phabio]|uniref:Uncharacterized protein n=1 Tax=Pseudomonas phage Phabio TaxID=2006668 RepID=A0A1Y0T2H9_9CAUD|nr:hypothetical protein MZD05_gp436 [Pseudomonas phage Phabio]ARV77067.1 hypothetical protein PHABIO_436 [Pseudomonas phage Phabio]
MSAKQVFDLNQKYNDRIAYLLHNLPKEVMPGVERHVLTAARDLYIDFLAMENKVNIDYLVWLGIITKFYRFQPLLAVDQDDVLANLAEKIINHPSLVDYFKQYVDTGVELDVLQLRLFVDSVNTTLAA